MTPTADMQHQAFAAAPDGLSTIAMEAAAVAIADGQLESAVELGGGWAAEGWMRVGAACAGGGSGRGAFT